MWNEGVKTFIADVALEGRRRVKIKAGTTTTPPEVEYAGAGEDYIGITEYAAAADDQVAVKLKGGPGTYEIEVTIGAAIARGTILYGAANGMMSDASSGSAQAVALEAGEENAIIEVVPYNVKSTTAATVSVADAGNIITAATVEAALAEIMTGIKTAQYTLLPQHICMEDGTALTVFADGVSGVGWTQLSSKDLALRWNNQATPDDIALQFVIPQDVDVTADMVLHLMGAIVKAGANEVDSPVVTVEAYFSTPGAAPGADANCGGDSGEFLVAATDTYQEKTLTIALADIPANPSVLTLVLHPKDGQLGTDDFLLLTPWIEAKRACLTS